MVKSLKLLEQNALNPLTRINNFMVMDPAAPPEAHPMSAIIENP